MVPGIVFLLRRRVPTSSDGEARRHEQDGRPPGKVSSLEPSAASGAAKGLVGQARECRRGASGLRPPCAHERARLARGAGPELEQAPPEWI